MSSSKSSSELGIEKLNKTKVGKEILQHLVLKDDCCFIISRIYYAFFVRNYGSSFNGVDPRIIAMKKYNFYNDDAFLREKIEVLVKETELLSILKETGGSWYDPWRSADI